MRQAPLRPRAEEASRPHSRTTRAVGAKHPILLGNLCGERRCIDLPESGAGERGRRRSRGDARPPCFARVRVPVISLNLLNVYKILEYVVIELMKEKSRAFHASIFVLAVCPDKKTGYSLGVPV